MVVLCTIKERYEACLQLGFLLSFIFLFLFLFFRIWSFMIEPLYFNISVLHIPILNQSLLEIIILFRFTKFQQVMLKHWHHHWWACLRSVVLESFSFMSKTMKIMIQNLMRGWIWTKLQQGSLSRIISFPFLLDYFL